jgi:hypothetical protein
MAWPPALLLVISGVCFTVGGKLCRRAYRQINPVVSLENRSPNAEQTEQRVGGISVGERAAENGKGGEMPKLPSTAKPEFVQLADGNSYPKIPIDALEKIVEDAIEAGEEVEILANAATDPNSIHGGNKVVQADQIPLPPIKGVVEIKNKGDETQLAKILRRAGIAVDLVSGTAGIGSGAWLTYVGVDALPSTFIGEVPVGMSALSIGLTLGCGVACIGIGGFLCYVAYKARGKKD